MSKLLIVFLLFLFGVSVISYCDIDPNKVVVINVKEEPVISLKIWFKVGSQDDPRGKEGLAYLTARMLSEGGTESDSYEEILAKMFPLAASYNAKTSVEMTIFQGKVHKDNLEEYMNLFTKQLLIPAFKESDFQRIQANTLNYLRTNLKYSNDEELGKAVLYNAIFDGTSYGHLTVGTIKSLETITIEDVKSFYKKFFNRNNFVIGLAGGFDENLPKEIYEDLQNLSDGLENNTKKVVPKKIEGLNVSIVNKKSNATAISIGFPIDILRGSKEWYALALANSYFGEHRNSSSHLYQVIREARGLNYGDYSYIENFPNGGRYQMPPTNVARKQQIFEIWIRPVPNESKHFSLRAALRELQILVDNGLTKEQFLTTKNFLKKYILQFAPELDTRLGYSIDDKFYNLNNNHLEYFRKVLDELTLEDVNNSIKRHLQYQNLHIVMITDEDDKLKEALVNNTTSPIQYSTPKPDEVLEEDKFIIDFRLNILPEKVKLISLDELFN